MKAVDYDDQKFARRIKKYRECRLNKRVLQWITIKIKTIGLSNIDKKKNKKSNVKDVPADENKDSILNLPAVASAPTTDNIMKHTEVDEPAVRNGVVGGADVTGGDMEVVEAGERWEDAAIKADNEAVKELLEKKEFNVSNGQENQSKDKPSTELIPDDTEILDKGGGKDSSDGGGRVII